MVAGKSQKSAYCRARRSCARPLRAVLVALLLGVLLPAGAAASDVMPRAAVAQLSAAGAVPPPVDSAPGGGAISVRVLGPVRRVPRSWLGFSVEWDELSLDTADPAGFARMLASVRIGRDPVQLRVGGETADETYWPTPGVTPPAQNVTLTPGYFQALAKVAKSVPLRTLIDLNLAARSTRMATLVARRARAAMPAGSVSGYEIGNEPDLYADGLIGNHQVAVPSASFGGFAIGYSPADYRVDFGHYARALRRTFGRVRLAGPAMATNSLSWAGATTRQGANTLTIHRYPFGSCLPPTDPKFPTVAKYMSAAASSEYAARSIRLIRFAHAAGQTAVVSEFGSSFCGGADGVTNTFATALWGADTLMSFLKDGADAVDAHLRYGYPNSAFNGVPGGFQANPLYYGMVAVARTLIAGGQLERTASTGVDVPVWVVRARGGALRVLAINKTPHPVTVVIQDRRRFRRGATARLLRLTAPSPEATGQVTWAGRWIDTTGRWRGRETTARVRFRRGWRVRVAGDSAALLITP